MQEKSNEKLIDFICQSGHWSRHLEATSCFMLNSMISPCYVADWLERTFSDGTHMSQTEQTELLRVADSCASTKPQVIVAEGLSVLTFFKFLMTLDNMHSHRTVTKFYSAWLQYKPQNETCHAKLFHFGIHLIRDMTVNPSTIASKFTATCIP